MTFGEKLREARKKANLSQEEFARKAGVSRSAVAKWESDRGMPDVENLKVIASLLNISLDYLLDDDGRLTFNETREPVDLESYMKTGKCRDKKDAACYAKYKDADAIYPLIRRKKQSLLEKTADFIVQPGIVQIADYMNNSDGYFLVETKGRQILVRVGKDFITSSELANRVDPKKFVIGNNVFRRTTYQLI
ncbi:MAG: helix-turn-helix transcriptional regulator [Erysipelotrichaceae bacterium]|nr:helix-turn-helix transcriptional regulator [Erysipelotrichaceae bacterium]